MTPDEKWLDAPTGLADLSADSRARALELLIAHHGKRLLRIIQVRLDPRIAKRVDPSDVLQEALLDIAHRLPNYDPARGIPIFPWMRMIVHERLIAIHRIHLHAEKRDARRDIPLVLSSQADQSSLSLAHAILASDSSVGGKLVREEQQLQLASALEQLEEEDREIILLRTYEQLSNQEVALALGVTEQAASKRFARAAQRLGKILRQLPGYQSEFYD